MCCPPLIQQADWFFDATAFTFAKKLVEHIKEIVWSDPLVWGKLHCGKVP